MPSVTLVVAHARNRVIGREGAMPWHLPADLAHFKRVTLGKPVIMGRRTHQSIGKALPGRTNIIVTRDREFRPDGVVVVHDLETAFAAVADAEEVMVIGGAEVYRQVMPLASRIELTLIDADIAGDVHFPQLQPGEWHEVARERRTPDTHNAYALDFITLQRVTRRNVPG